AEENSGIRVLAEGVRPQSPGLIWLQFFGIALIWGSGFLFLKILIAEVSVVQLVFARVAIGSIVLAIWMSASRRSWPKGIRIWLHVLALGTIFCVIPFGLYAWGTQHLPSGLASIFNSVTPLGTLLIALIFIPAERLAGIKLIAFLSAAFGLVVIVSPWLIDFSSADPNYYLGQLACISGSLCYAIGGVYTRWLLKTSGYDSIALMSSMVVAATVLLLPVMAVYGLDPIEPKPIVFVSALVLGIFGTGIAYAWNANVIRGLGVTRATIANYISPVVGVVLGMIVLHEQLLWYEILGSSIVIIAVAVSQGAFDWIPKMRRRSDAFSSELINES
ncbi:MAG: DMT family transporter, partial [Microbacteriaceae bacterium]